MNETLYFDLLKQWCDSLIKLQLKGVGPVYDGAFLCPACKYEHGRCFDAIYPFMYMADRTGDDKYVKAAVAVFDWTEANTLCDDGSMWNDPNAAWSMTTVFATVSLCEALSKHSSKLAPDVHARFQARLERMAQWLYDNLDESAQTNINYIAANSAALALAGKYLGQYAYIEQASNLARYALEHITPNGLLYGEGKPRDAITARGCRPVDIGYNVEESIPSLVKYAVAAEDAAALDQLADILKKQLDFMLPDGAWDNSFGSRNNKWTYYGSRTSDGCQSAYALMADRAPEFAEAAYRNTLLMQRCSEGGLLHGGPEYAKYGERPCVHHTFTHANALACALDAGIEDRPHGGALPSDNCPTPLRYYPEIDTYKISTGDLRATVTAYDYAINAGHATGGALTQLWHAKLGPVIAGSVVDYRLVEPTNQQLPLQKKRHRSLVPRVEVMLDGKRYSQCYDTKAVISASGNAQRVTVKVHAALVDIEQNALPKPLLARLEYQFTTDAVGITGHVYGNDFAKARFVLPITCKAVRAGINGRSASEEIFCLTGGFGATEYTVYPDADGRFSVVLDLGAEG